MIGYFREWEQCPSCAADLRGLELWLCHLFEHIYIYSMSYIMYYTVLSVRATKGNRSGTIQNLIGHDYFLRATGTAHVLWRLGVGQLGFFASCNNCSGETTSTAYLVCHRENEQTSLCRRTCEAKLSQMNNNIFSWAVQLRRISTILSNWDSYKNNGPHSIKSPPSLVLLSINCFPWLVEHVVHLNKPLLRHGQRHGQSLTCRFPIFCYNLVDGKNGKVYY